MANSNPATPAKDAAAESSATTDSEDQPAQIPVLFGQETLNVKIRLASVSVSGAADKK